MTARTLLHSAALATLVAGSAAALESGWTAGNTAGTADLLPKPQDHAAAGDTTAGTAEIDGARVMDKSISAAALDALPVTQDDQIRSN